MTEIVIVNPSQKRTCEDCKFAGTYKRPRIMEETGFGDQLMFEGPGEGKDGTGDETVYMCKAPASVNGLMSPFVGTERIVPITCEVWRAAEPVSDEKFAEMDRMIAEREKRMKAKDER